MKVGFISTAGIARKTWAAIHATEGPHSAVVTAVASREKKRAQEFIDDLQTTENARCKFSSPIPEALASYDDLVKNKNSGVDTVYVPIPMALRKPVCLQAMANNQHVVCEKPISHCMSDVEELFAAADKNDHRIFLDGTMLSHGKRIQEIQKIILNSMRDCQQEEKEKEKKQESSATSCSSTSSSSPISSPEAVYLGCVSTVVASFSFPASREFLENDIRTNMELECLGALGDVGHYAIRYVVDAFGPENIRVVRARADNLETAENGANLTHAGIVEFEFVGDNSNNNEKKNRKINLIFQVSFLEAHQQRITFKGTKKTLTVNDFCLPFVDSEALRYSVESHNINSTGLRVDHCEMKQDFIVHESSKEQETLLWENVARVAAGLKEKEGSEKKQEALKIRESWKLAIRRTQEAIVLCYKSAYGKGSSGETGNWLLLEEAYKH